MQKIPSVFAQIAHGINTTQSHLANKTDECLIGLPPVSRRSKSGNRRHHSASTPTSTKKLEQQEGVGVRSKEEQSCAGEGGRQLAHGTDDDNTLEAAENESDESTLEPATPLADNKALARTGEDVSSEQQGGNPADSCSQAGEQAAPALSVQSNSSTAESSSGYHSTDVDRQCSPSKSSSTLSSDALDSTLSALTSSATLLLSREDSQPELMPVKTPAGHRQEEAKDCGASTRRAVSLPRHVVAGKHGEEVSDFVGRE